MNYKTNCSIGEKFRSELSRILLQPSSMRIMPDKSFQFPAALEIVYQLNIAPFLCMLEMFIIESLLLPNYSTLLAVLAYLLQPRASFLRINFLRVQVVAILAAGYLLAEQ